LPVIYVITNNKVIKLDFNGSVSIAYYIKGSA